MSAMHIAISEPKWKDPEFTEFLGFWPNQTYLQELEQFFSDESSALLFTFVPRTTDVALRGEESFVPARATGQLLVGNGDGLMRGALPVVM
jgi:hypothetical protein